MARQSAKQGDPLAHAAVRDAWEDAADGSLSPYVTGQCYLIETISLYYVGRVVRQGPGWPYYARPMLGAREFAPADVVRVRQRQTKLGIPEAFEWVAETTPGVARAVQATGLPVAAHPLMVESVAWVTERKNVLSAVFYFAAALSYVAWASRPSTARATRRRSARARSS